MIAGIVCVAAAGCGGSGPKPAQIAVDPAVGLWDSPLAVTVSGLAPDERASLHAVAYDRSGKTFVSNTTISADAKGRVALRGGAAMRLLWSLHPPGAGPADYYVYQPPPRGEVVRLTLGSGSRTQAAARVTRELLVPGEHSRPLRPRRTGLYGEMYYPPSTQTRRPGVLLFGGSEGGLVTTDIATLLAARGYPTLALAYFAEVGLPRRLVRIRLEYFVHALRWLARQPGVDRRRLVVAGISRGSEAAQLLGVHYPDLVHGVVALVPSNAAVCGIPCSGPAWTFRGRAVRYSDVATPYAEPALPDERINGPIFLDCGGMDARWPSCPMAHAIAARLRAHRFAHAVTLLAYPNAGHGVGYLLPNDPFYGPTGGTVPAEQRARTQAWPRLLAFLRSLR